ncbi:MAG: Ig-like domain-containing protein [Sulfurimonas sp.]|uniref:Ig-like domain-containing protein n=1 Tax=Sulfurimonas sp. TaxID=2022749 RepID=UPI0028CDCC07|nr:Ig-like domain-containing protein [Sulfurimonas sp.]MDT8338793.1 Ig-like domain-containing protein [Sulfurimonas sp.]
MSHFFIKLVLFCTISVGLHAQSGLAQQYLVSVSPEHLAEFESPNTNVEITFTMPVEAKSIHKNTVVLKAATNKRLSGTSRAIGNKIVFTPDAALEVGTYEVLVQKVKLDDPSTNNTQTERINYNFTVPDLQSIAISLSSIEVKEGTQITLSVTGTYADSSTKEILDNIEWRIQNNSIASISNNTLSGLTEGVTTIQAKFNNITSTPVTVVVYKEINGYKLPPEPDPAVNNSTLLGIDFNNNGVRDDVEIYVIKRFAKDPEFPKTKTALAMQYAWSAQKILENPTMESSKFEDDAISCQYYWFDKKQKDINQRIINLDETDFNAAIQEALKAGKWRSENKVFNDSEIKDKIYNTRARIEQKFSYNSALSGNILKTSPATAEKCQTNIDELGE